MTKMYYVEWKTQDDLLDCVLKRYITSSSTLNNALQKAADIESLFGIECAVRDEPVKKQRVSRHEDVDCQIVWNTADEQLNDVLYVYCVSDRKAVRRLFRGVQ